MKRVIITGPTGAIGIALIQELLKHDIPVTAVCHRGSKRISRLPVSEQLTVVECNLDELSGLPDMLEYNYDVFYHLAWACTTGDSRNNIQAQLQNLQYTMDAVETARDLGCKRFVGAGSQAEYGRYEGMLNAGTPVFPENAYGMAKLAAGQMSRIRCEQLGMEHIWTRVLSVYGPYDGEGTLIISLIRQLLRGESPKCTKGEQIWDYIYAKDAGRAFYLLGDRGQNGRVYCIGSGKGRLLAEYMKEVRNRINPKLHIGFGKIPYGDKQVMHLCADITELQNDTGFTIQYSFEQGIQETIDWCRTEMEI